MSRGDDLRKLDIVDACIELEVLVQERGRVAEEILLRAAERLLEIIGEAATRCSEEFRQSYPQVDWTALSGLRVVLAHHYHRADPSLIWQFASVDAAKLRQLLQ